LSEAISPYTPSGASRRAEDLRMNRDARPLVPLLRRRGTASTVTVWAVALVPLAFFLAGLIVPK